MGGPGGSVLVAWNPLVPVRSVVRLARERRYTYPAIVRGSLRSGRDEASGRRSVRDWGQPPAVFGDAVPVRWLFFDVLRGFSANGVGHGVGTPGSTLQFDLRNIPKTGSLNHTYLFENGQVPF